jgi:hypothetical protein
VLVHQVNISSLVVQQSNGFLHDVRNAAAHHKVAPLLLQRSLLAQVSLEELHNPPFEPVLLPVDLDHLRAVLGVPQSLMQRWVFLFRAKGVDLVDSPLVASDAHNRDLTLHGFAGVASKTAVAVAGVVLDRIFPQRLAEEVRKEERMLGSEQAGVGDKLLALVEAQVAPVAEVGLGDLLSHFGAAGQVLIVVYKVIAALAEGAWVFAHVLEWLGRVGHSDGSAERSWGELFGVVALFAEFVAWLVGGWFVFFDGRRWRWCGGAGFAVLRVGERCVCSSGGLEA